jgi:hypothetical protein
MTKTTSNKSIKENMSKRSVLKSMKNVNMIMEQLDCQEEEQEEHHGFGAIGLLGTLVRKTSQLETTTLLGSTSKRSTMALIISQENMSKRNKNITDLKQKEHHPKA